MLFITASMKKRRERWVWTDGSKNSYGAVKSPEHLNRCDTDTSVDSVGSALMIKHGFMKFVQRSNETSVSRLWNMKQVCKVVKRTRCSLKPRTDKSCLRQKKTLQRQRGSHKMLTLIFYCSVSTAGEEVEVQQFSLQKEVCMRIWVCFTPDLFPQ